MTAPVLVNKPLASSSVNNHIEDTSVRLFGFRCNAQENRVYRHRRRERPVSTV
jgi:hypothetical protein